MASFFEDVIRSDSRFNSVKRVADINLLEPVTRSAVSRIVEDAGALGIDLMVFETYRSQARQQELFNQVRRSFGSWESTISDSQLTWSKLLVAKPSWKGDFSFLGRLAHEHGLIWGGDWGDPAVPHTFIDAVHVQRCAVSLQPALFRGSFYPDADYNPYRAARATVAA